MVPRFTSVLVHALGLAFVCAMAAYWGVRILTPPPTAAPPPMAAPLPREPDPVLAARLFGLVQQQAPARLAVNIQVAGLFAAGRSSSAVLAVDGRPPRAFVLGQEVAPGNRLIEVSAEGVVIETAAGRQELRAPTRPAAGLATGTPARAYVLEGGALSPTAVESPDGRAGASPPPVAPNLGPISPPRGPALNVPADAHAPGRTPPAPEAAQPARD